MVARPLPGLGAGGPVDLIALLPIDPVDPKTGGERYNRIVLDGLRARGLSVSIVDRETLLRDRLGVLRRATQSASRVLIDTWLYRDLHDIVLELSPDCRAKLATLSHLCYWRTYTRPWVRTLHRRRVRRLLSVAGHRIGVSQALLDHDLGPYRDPLRDAVVYPGCELTPRRTVREGGSTEILSIANYHPRKGFELLIHALAELRRTSLGLGEGARLRLVGDLEADPRYVDSLRALARRLSLKNQVIFDGWTDRPGVARRLERASLFTLASSSEGFGMVVAEALRFGLPAVVTPFETARELLAELGHTAVVERTPRALAAGWRSVLARPVDKGARASLMSRGKQIAPPWSATVGALHDVLFPARRSEVA